MKFSQSLVAFALSAGASASEQYDYVSIPSNMHTSQSLTQHRSSSVAALLAPPLPRA